MFPLTARRCGDFVNIEDLPDQCSKMLDFQQLVGVVYIRGILQNNASLLVFE